VPYVIPVENEDIVTVDASIKDGVATLSDITKDVIDKTISDRSDVAHDNRTITIDLSAAESLVTALEIKTESLNNISEAIKNNESINSINIKMTNASVSLDATAVESITSQAGGDTIRLVVDGIPESKLNSAQRSAIERFSYKTPFEVYFESGGSRISDFGGGKANVSIKYDIPQGMRARFFHMYYIAPDGTLSRYFTWFKDGAYYFMTPHFSDYVIVYDETMPNDSVPDGMTRNSDGTITEHDSDMGDVVIASEVINDGKVYRMYNPYTGEHTYTKNPLEVLGNVSLGWIHEEDVSFSAFGYDMDGSVPVYRLYSSATRLHHYTMDRGEVIWDVEALGFDFEGVAFFALPADATEGSAVYRLYNPYNYQHLWTTNKVEYDYLRAIGWNQEGVAFKVQ